MSAAWGFEVAIRVARVIIGVSEGITVIEKEFHGFDGDRKAQSFTKSDLHIRDADDFAGHIEQRAPAVARIDLRSGLEIKLAAELARLGAENAFSNGAFKTKRAADCKNAFPHRHPIS